MNYFDLHCDTPYECFTKKQPFFKNNLAVSGEKGAAFQNWKQVFAVWIDDRAEEPYRLYHAILRDFKEKLADRPTNLTPYFAVEGGAVLEDDIERLSVLKEDGVRALTLTWNDQNRIAGGSKSDQGLTDFGKAVIAEMNRLQIACDLSHLNDKSFFAAIELTRYPIATHSNSRAVCDVPRNLTDEQLCLLAKRGGIVGLCLYPAFLGGGTAEKLYEHICHMLDLGLENSLAIGSDFDGAEMAADCADLSKIPYLYRKLNEMGLENALLDKIFYKNAEKYFETFDKRATVL